MLLALCLALPLAASAEVIAHLFEWRFDDIQAECRDFLPKHKYAAIQVSPVSESAVLKGRPWYERYQPFSYKIISRSGDEQAFRAMVETCNANGIKVYVDVILNHMSATLDRGTLGTGGSKPDTSNKYYPDVLYNSSHFHSTCSIVNSNDPWKERNCELLGLHDLDTSKDYVRNRLAGFMNRLIDIGVSGFRVDAAKHISVDDLKAIYGKVKNLPSGLRPYFYQEVAGNPDNDVIKPYDYFMIGSCMDFKYGFELARAFRRKNMLKWFKTFGTSWGLLPADKSVVFVDNHDSQRGGIMGIDALTYKESKLYKMATGFMLSWPHKVARVMSSYGFSMKDAGPPGSPGEISHVVRNPDLSCSGGWICEHRWRQIYNMVIFASVVGDEPVREWWDNGNYQIAYCRGNKGFVAINAEGSLDTYLQTCLPAGVYCDVVSGSLDGNRCTGKTVNVNSDGKAHIVIPQDREDGFLAIHIQASLKPGSVEETGASPMKKAPVGKRDASQEAAKD